MENMIRFSGVVGSYNGQFNNVWVDTFDKVKNSYPSKYKKGLNSCLVFGSDLPKAYGLKVFMNCNLKNNKNGKSYLACDKWSFLWPNSIKSIRALFVETIIKSSLISIDKLDDLLKEKEEEFLNAFKDGDLSTLLPLLCPIGSSKEMIEDMTNCLNDINKYHDSNLAIKLEKYGVSLDIQKRILDYYKITSLSDLNNPYDCIETLGLSFDMCKRIAKAINKKDLNSSVSACTKSVLVNLGESSKNLYFDYEMIGNRVIKMLNDIITFDNFNEVISKCSKDPDSFIYVNEYDNKKIIMLKKDMENELCAAKKLKLLTNCSNSQTINELISSCVSKLNGSSEFSFTNEQLTAIATSLQNKVSIITGGPGTGKTTVVKGIIKVYKMIHGMHITCMAPTGKAASRMAEATGIKASTIHSAIKMIPNEASELRKIDKGLVIVDECSMIDQETFTRMLDMIQTGSTLVLLGDVNQLPSVGKGNVLNELIKSNMIKTSVLTMNKRQDNASSIVENSFRILDQNSALLFDENTRLLDLEDNNTDALINLYLESVQKYKEDEVMVLCPLRNQGTRKLNMVSSKLNLLIRDFVNPLKEEQEVFVVNTKDGVIDFRVGDRVMSWKNMDDVLNGEVGKITYLDNSVVNITWENGQTCAYNNEEMANITLAYSMSVHKSQGSEYKCVIMPLLSKHTCGLFNRNLIYTGLTRAKEECIFVGDKKAIDKAIKTCDTSVRNSLLAYRLKTNMK